MYTARGVEDAIDSLGSFLDSEASHAVEGRCYFLTGGAGAGKTHLLLDAVRVALDEGRPAAVVFAAQLGRGDIWGSICDQLGLPALGRDIILGAMDLIAEASSRYGRRFVLMVDALNDTPDVQFWASHLSALRAAILAFPHVALAVSCRDAYLEAVDPDGRRSEFTLRRHPGFAGREVEATQMYFAHYGLPEPQVPLLLPEFTVPLFLQMYCESLADRDPDVGVATHESRVAVFERVRRSKTNRAIVRLAPNASKSEADERRAGVGDYIDALLEEMVVTGREDVPRVRALDLAVAAGTASDKVSAATILGSLLDEGLFHEAPTYTDGHMITGVHVAFQAFADYLILRRRLEGLDVATQVDDAFREWLFDASWGIREAASVVLPEMLGVELFHVLHDWGKLHPPKGAHERWLQNYLRNLEGMFVATLPYRTTASITDRTLTLLNMALGHGRIEEVLVSLFALAPQPAHPLNGDRLHRWLLRYRMPRRDQIFGQAMYYAFTDEASAPTRLARWAANGPYPSYSADVVELAAIPLVWLLSSPNRFMRDWTTKALVQLLGGHHDVLRRLLERFLVVDDPYVVERMVTIAYGVALRCGSNASGLQGAIDSVANHVFGSVTAPICDALVLDAAYGLMEWAAMRQLEFPIPVSETRPRHGFTRPGNPWSWATIDLRYPTDAQKDDKSYATILYSLFGMGDFSRYVIEPAVRHFSKVPLEDEPPRIPEYQARERTLVKS